MNYISFVFLGTKLPITDHSPGYEPVDRVPHHVDVDGIGQAELAKVHKVHVLVKAAAAAFWAGVVAAQEVGRVVLLTAD